MLTQPSPSKKPAHQINISVFGSNRGASGTVNSRILKLGNGLSSGPTMTFPLFNRAFILFWRSSKVSPLTGWLLEALPYRIQSRLHGVRSTSSRPVPLPSSSGQCAAVAVVAVGVELAAVGVASTQTDRQARSAAHNLETQGTGSGLHRLLFYGPGVEPLPTVWPSAHPPTCPALLSSTGRVLASSRYPRCCTSGARPS